MTAYFNRHYEDAAGRQSNLSRYFNAACGLIHHYKKTAHIFHIIILSYYADYAILSMLKFTAFHGGVA